MIGKLKKIFLPTGQVKEVDALESWTVSWKARTGDFSGNWRMCYEVFIDENTAKEYKQRLEESTKFLRDEWTRDIKLTKN